MARTKSRSRRDSLRLFRRTRHHRGYSPRRADVNREITPICCTVYAVYWHLADVAAFTRGCLLSRYSRSAAEKLRLEPTERRLEFFGLQPSIGSTPSGGLQISTPLTRRRASAAFRGGKRPEFFLFLRFFGARL